jgi:hypothetical protein
MSKRKKILFFIIAAVVLILLSFCASCFLPVGIDWHYAFYPAVRAVLQGYSPYPNAAFFNPPWAIIPILPFGLLSEKLSFGFIFSISIICFAYLGWKFGAKIPGILIILTSLPVLICITEGNIDWLVLSGVLLPPQFGLLLVLIKPQVGVAVAMFWVWEAWESQKIKGLIKLFTPLIIVTVISFLIFPHWIDDIRISMQIHKSDPVNSIWPVSIPAGFYLLYRMIKNRDIKTAIAAGPFLSPYVLFQSWSGLIISLSHDPIGVMVVSLGIWIMRLIQTGVIRLF